MSLQSGCGLVPMSSSNVIIVVIHVHIAANVACRVTCSIVHSDAALCNDSIDCHMNYVSMLISSMHVLQHLHVPGRAIIICS